MGRKTTNPAPVNEDADLEQIMDEIDEESRPSDIEVMSDLFKKFDNARRRKVIIEGAKTVVIGLLIGVLVGVQLGSSNQRTQDQTIATAIRKG